MPQDRSPRPPVPMLAAAAVTLPGAALGALSYLGTAPALPPYLLAVVFGTAIIGAAFLLSWAAEAIQVDVSAGLALAVLALVAVLPEYAVDFVFTFEAGQVYAAEGQCVPSGGGDGSNPCSLALANMTGANRVLVGIGWPLLVLVAAWSARRHRRAAEHTASVPAPGRVELKPTMSTEVVFLGFATLYSLTLPLRTSLTLVDAAVLVAVFVVYAWRLAQAPAEDPDLIGTSEWVAGHARRPRHAWVGGMFAVAAVVILLCAEHFAGALVETGSALGVDEFVLVQWLAPLASESPELIVACLYAWRLKASDSLGTLLSSKVNQWTLLVGTIPIVFAVSSTSLQGLPLDTQQRLELLLTAAQSLFAVSLLVTLRLTWRGATTLLVLFVVQFVASVALSTEVDRLVIQVLSGLYVLLALGLFVRHGRRTGQLVKDGTVTPFHQLEEEAEEQEAVTR
ncbi:sodium/calcium exchanger protein [Modestobacter sp. SYSU DS0875]